MGRAGCRLHQPVRWQWGCGARVFLEAWPRHSQTIMLYVNQKAAGVVEAKPEGSTLTGVEVQSDKYSTGLPDNLPALLSSAPVPVRKHRRGDAVHQQARPESREADRSSPSIPLNTLCRMAWLPLESTASCLYIRIAEEQRRLPGRLQPAATT